MIYIFLARASLYFVIQPQGIAAVWLPSGLGLGLLILSRQQRWRFALPVIFIANASANLWGGNSLPVSLGFALTLSAEAWLAASLLKRYWPQIWTSSQGFKHSGEMIGWLATILLSDACTALAGAAIAAWAHGTTFLSAWIIWLVSDGLGLLLITPLVLAWGRPPARSMATPAQVFEGLLLAILLNAIALYTFFSPQPELAHSMLRAYLLFPGLIWAALRFDERYITLILTVLVLLAALGTNNGLGQFSDPTQSPAEHMLTMQVYLGMVIFSIFILRAILAEREQMREMLHANQERLQSVFENSPDTIFILDLQTGRINFINRPFLSGYSKEELAHSHTLLALVHPQDLERVHAHWQRIRSGEIPGQIEYRLHAKSGGYAWLQQRSASLSGAGGYSRHEIQVTLTDITERKQTELIFQAHLRLVEFSVTHTLDELLSATLDEAEALTDSRIGFYHFLNEDQIMLSLQNWSTRTLKEFCMAGGKGMHYPLDKAGVWADCVRERRPVIHNDYASLPQRKGLPTGHAILHRELIVPVFRSERIVSILGVGNKALDYDMQDLEMVTQLADLAWDITERKRAEQALRQSELLLKETQSISKVGGWEYELLTRKATWTSEVYHLFGVGLDHDPSNIPLTLSFYAPEEQQVIKQAFEQAINAGQPFLLDLQLLTAQGESRWVRIHGKPLIENAKVIRVTGNIMDITETRLAEDALRAANRKLERQAAANETLLALLVEQATHDALTGLYNRRFMDEAIRRELARANREGYPISLLMLDIDHFKDFNDTHGHEAGDQVLVALGELLHSNIRESDTACRYGGEEFVVILPGADVQDALSRAETIREAFASARIVSGNLVLSATVSVGIAMYPSHCTSVDELLHTADAAMYMAKQSGRNRVQIWSAPNG